MFQCCCWSRPLEFPTLCRWHYFYSFWKLVASFFFFFTYLFIFGVSFFKLIYYYYYFFLLYNIVFVLLYINMHLPRVYTCSPSWTPLLPPPSPYYPSGSSQCTSPKLPVSCIEPGLEIHFLHDIIHVLMPFSKIMPPHFVASSLCS